MQQPDLSIYAERAEIDRVTKLGSFFNANGTARLGNEPVERSPFGTQEPDVMFHGEEIAKVGPKRYRLRNGAFTTCAQPTPRWMMTGSNVTIALDQYVLMRHMVLRVKDVPLLYLPGMYYPINKEDRSTGFLLPTYGSSTIGGTSLSNAFFWAISRSQDATIRHMWNTKGGQVYAGEYRYVTAPGSQGSVNAQLESIKGLTSATTVDTGRRNLRVTGGAAQVLPRGFYLNSNVNYFTDIIGQQRHQDIAIASQSSRSWSATLTGNVSRLRLNAAAEQTDYFYGPVPGARSGKRPMVNLSLPDRPIGRSRVYYGVSGESAYLVRNPDASDPTKDESLWRFDARPAIRAPLSTLPYLSATAGATWYLTRWQESYSPGSQLQVPIAMNRQMLSMNASLTGPVLARVFQTPDNGYAERFKHVIEPFFRISRTTPFDQVDRVVKYDYNDWLTGGDTRIEYRLSNKLLARRRAPGAVPGVSTGAGIVREILTVDLRQTYYSDVRGSQSDPSVETATSDRFGPLVLNASTRPNDTTVGQFQIEMDSRYRKVRSYSASTTIQSTFADVQAGWRRTGVIPERPEFALGSQTHYLNAGTTLRSANNVIGGSYDINLDIKNSSVTNQRITAYYNSQCCGISFDWQSLSTPLYDIKTDRRFGVSFTLAGIGSFANPMGGLGGGR
jgi:LPS-assembly protein